MRKVFDNHHIVPSSIGGTNYYSNIVRLDIRKHQAIHMLFDNRSPPEQIRRILEIASTALTDEVKSDVIELLSIKDRDYWYKKGVIKK